MIVYGVGIEYEGIHAVFSTFEKAQEYIAEQTPSLQDIYYIENLEVK